MVFPFSISFNEDVLTPVSFDSFSKLILFFFLLFSQTVINKRRPGLIEEHREIVTALFNRDIDLAVSLLESHLKNNLEFSLYYLDFKNNK
ncbi:FCD domain-containing protein [Staphylococcus saprophyticus]|uniref:FCD domain-containing protein n=1 Tax=Staphylococcus saprophyticus TaxID=29385 RepID=UPI00289FB6DF|nr:FCD domain-containing protein [Staphylococcus saprophyticus]